MVQKGFSVPWNAKLSIFTFLLWYFLYHRNYKMETETDTGQAFQQPQTVNFCLVYLAPGFKFSILLDSCNSRRCLLKEPLKGDIFYPPKRVTPKVRLRSVYTLKMLHVNRPLDFPCVLRRSFYLHCYTFRRCSVRLRLSRRSTS